MFKYMNKAGVVFEKEKKEMVEFLQSGAGQTLSIMENREDWVIETKKGFTYIQVSLRNTKTNEVMDINTATIIFDQTN